MHLSEGAVHFDSFSSQVARGSFSVGIACSLCSLDQTAHFLIAAWNPRRPWQKQVGAHSRKCPLTTTTHHAQAPGETTGMYESRSHPPCALGKSGSSMEANALHRSTRDPAALASRALSPVLEAQVKGLFSQAQGSGGNCRIDQRNGDGESALGC